MLDKLKKSGAHLAVVTGKPEVTAISVLENQGIDGFFECVAGPSLANKNPTKSALIQRALDELGVEDRSEVVMIGDRVFDIEGANAEKIDSIGVLYGYGSEEELKIAGATYLLSDVSEIC